MTITKTILVAPLNWGLGHAARCIPIIQELRRHQYKVLLGSDGPSLLLLRKEFPDLPYIELPTYGIQYPKNGSFFRIKMVAAIPQIRTAIISEKRIIKKLVKEGRIDGIISDNRLGVRHKKVPSVIVTHQLNVLSGATSAMSSQLHQNYIKKFTACWVPDVMKSPNLSGKLGHPKKLDFPVTYIGPLSRMQKEDRAIVYDILVLLSGPEPQRSILESQLLEMFLKQPHKVLVVRGVVEEKIKTTIKENITMVNYMQSKTLERAINESSVVISRAGYTTIMDLAALEKTAYFIPTPGQYEQEYLAKQLKDKGIVPSSSQEKFKLEKLERVKVYKGLSAIKAEVNYARLFRLFEGEREF